MSDENPSLLDALLSVRTAEPPVMAGVAGETRKWEQKGDTLTLEAKAPTEPGDAKVEDWMVARGYDPDLWVATGFRSSEWTMANGETGVSVRYTFTKAPEGRERVDIDELLAIVNEARPGRLATPAEQLTDGPGFVLALGDMQFGKALADDTPILTPKGWVEHGALRPGDEVFGADGTPKMVLAVTGSTDQELFEVKLRDGTSLLATGDHLWSGVRSMHTPTHKTGGPAWEERHMVLSTKELARVVGQKNSRSFYLDRAEPVQFPEKELPVDPYLLGMWLGDGNSATGIIGLGVEDAAMLDGIEGARPVPSNCRDNFHSVRVVGLSTALRALGVLGSKHIPNMYLDASVGQRLALVQGLMDTDGHAATSGILEFTNTNKFIVDGMAFLLRSLGIRPVIVAATGSLYGVDKLPYWRLTFRADMPMFRLGRKLARQRPATERVRMRDAVVAVRSVGVGSAQCVTVEGGLYLAGHHLTVTHNCDKDGPEGAVRRTLDCIDRAVESLVRYQSTAVVPVSHVHIAWLGDHIEGFVSQGGANAWRTTLTLSEQVRLTRRAMLYAVQRFAPLAGRLTVVAVPGNHGEPQRFAGKGVTRYDDSHDTEALHAVADACQMNPGAYGHVEFYTPDRDELTVVLEVAGTYLAHVHGDQWGAGKHFNWWQGQAFGAEVGLQHCDMLLAGHWHHLKLEQSGGRLYVQVPALEAESTWWRHRTGIGGNPGALVMLVSEGSLLGVEVV